MALCVQAVALSLRPQALKPKLKMWYTGRPLGGCLRMTLIASLQATAYRRYPAVHGARSTPVMYMFMMDMNVARADLPQDTPVACLL